eukprot:CAMPEP_0118890588 /NCGR_PEP_ID=MMETSP1166-20130328/981_1 /TAXON_ID=1104430 /ORGANISM="Chrysoreinhardia sp, Strain CCMP3193" /LENGTH=419 /DNA_ID=CAMNT_0006829205 /DNA_START=94 /DNA_END=1353 /DNA_ORIENTATION=+
MKLLRQQQQHHRVLGRRVLSTPAMMPPAGGPPSHARHHVVDDAVIQSNGGLLEYSVVYTDRALNHMSEPFQQVMTDLHASLTKAYNADHAVLVPGSGTYAMEAAARAFCGDGERALVVRNGYFSYRWSQILETLGKAEEEVTVMRARPVLGNDDYLSGIRPPPADEVAARILDERPSMVAAPHVETSAGLILPEEYIATIAAAAKDVGAAFVLDGVASGTAWVDLRKLGVDCYVTAPQKGWSGPAAVGVAMLSDRGLELAASRKPTSFAVDLAKWYDVMRAYLNGGHMYHTTMPTDAIRAFRDVVFETEDFGLARAQDECWRLGFGVRDALDERGFRSVAAPGFEAPGVAVVYAPPDASFAPKFKHAGLQIAAGVPLMIGEDNDTFNTFRIGLFGLDKLRNVDLTVQNFKAALNNVLNQ